MIIGLSAILSPISYSITYNKDVLLLLIGTILFSLYPFIGKKDTMTRINGLSFILMYAFYMGSTLFFTR